jgi:hypothetical protein
MRRRFDAGRFAKMAQRPGADPRVWVTQATVTKLGFDANEGIFADVQFMPSGEEETCRVGTDYAGNSFGKWNPLHEGDEVLVAVPMGDSNSGPVIIARMWSAADKPHPDFKASAEQDGQPVPTNDVVVRVEAGQRLVVRTSGQGGDVDIRVEGSGAVNLFVEGSGKVHVGDGDATGEEAMAKGTSIQNHLNALRVWAAAHTHNDPQGGVTGPPTVSPPTVPTVTALHGVVK